MPIQFMTAYVDVIVKLGFPTAIVVVSSLWFFLWYQPRQEKRDDTRHQKQQESFETRFREQQSANDMRFKEQRESNERMNTMVMETFKESLQRIVDRVDSVRNTVQVVHSNVDKLTTRIDEITGRQILADISGRIKS